MNNRVSGTIYRGDAVYYTFQRLTTGVEFLNRQEAKGRDPKTFRVEFTRDGKEQEMTGTKFRSWASGLKSEQPGAKAKPSKKSGKGKATVKPTAKPRKRTPAVEPEPELSGEA